MIETQKTDKALIVFFTEERLDMEISPGLMKELIAKIDEADSDIILNMKNVQYMDSSIIGVLVRFQKLITDNNKKLVITGITQNIEKIFRLTKLDRFFNIK